MLKIHCMFHTFKIKFEREEGNVGNEIRTFFSNSDFELFNNHYIIPK